MALLCVESGTCKLTCGCCCCGVVVAANDVAAVAVAYAPLLLPATTYTAPLRLSDTISSSSRVNEKPGATKLSA